MIDRRHFLLGGVTTAAVSAIGWRVSLPCLQMRMLQLRSAARLEQVL